MGERIKFVFNAEVLLKDNNGVKLQFDNSLYTEFNGYFNIKQDDEIVFAGSTNQILSVKCNNKEDIVYV